VYGAKMFVSAFQYPEKGVLRPKKDELKVFLYRVLPGVFFGPLLQKWNKS